ncbi:MAG: hypothetical protein U1F48_14480 [Burkholderiales bacterium]
MTRWLIAVTAFVTSFSAHAIPPSYGATVAVAPWVPTPQQHVSISVSDSYWGTIAPGPDFSDVTATVSGNVITVFAKFSTGNNVGIASREIDIGTLPAGRYTVKFSSDALDAAANPARHQATMSFSVAEGGLTTVVEFYNAARDHYFITANLAEMDLLDKGTMPGWARTGETFKVMYGETAQSTAKSVCRFYGLPAAGLDSHFFSVSMSECLDVINRWPTQWLLETTDAFAVAAQAPVAMCANGSQPLFRLYNNRADVNHRYTTSAATRDAMIAKGWILEGTGTPVSPAVGMCVPI